MENHENQMIAYFKKNKVHNITVIAALITAIIAYVIFVRTEAPNSITHTSEPEVVRPAPERIAVDVAGAVKSPGVYSFDAGTRLHDALKRAGGPSSRADNLYIAKQLNLASVLTDQQKIYIPQTGEEVVQSPITHQIQSTATSVSSDSSISINSADEKTLETLPGIGAVTAKKIVDNRPYEALNDLTDSKVISDAVFEKIKDRIAL